MLLLYKHKILKKIVVFILAGIFSLAPVDLQALSDIKKNENIAVPFYDTEEGVDHIEATSIRVTKVATTLHKILQEKPVLINFPTELMEKVMLRSGERNLEAFGFEDIQHHADRTVFPYIPKGSNAAIVWVTVTSNPEEIDVSFEVKRLNMQAVASGSEIDVDEYMLKMGWQSYVHLREPLSKVIHLLDERSALRVVFMRKLNQNEGHIGKFEEVNSDWVKKVGGQEFIEDHLCYLAGDAESANQLAENGVQIIVALSDEVSPDGWYDGTYNPASRRAVYLPVEYDGQSKGFLILSGTGPNVEPEKLPFYETKIDGRERIEGVVRKEPLGKLTRPEMIQEINQNWDWPFTPLLGIVDLKEVPVGDDKSFVLPEEAVITVRWTPEIHRSSKMFHLAKLDPDLELPRKRISNALHGVGLREQSDTISLEDFFILMAHNMGLQEAIKRNLGIYKDSFTIQDMAFVYETDLTSELKTFQEMVDLGFPAIALNLITSTLLHKIQLLTQNIDRYFEAIDKRDDQSRDLLKAKALEKFFKSYFLNLDDKSYLDDWENKLDVRLESGKSLADLFARQLDMRGHNLYYEGSSNSDEFMANVANWASQAKASSGAESEPGGEGEIVGVNGKMSYAIYPKADQIGKAIAQKIAKGLERATIDHPFLLGLPSNSDSSYLIEALKDLVPQDSNHWKQLRVVVLNDYVDPATNSNIDPEHSDSARSWALRFFTPPDLNASLIEPQQVWFPQVGQVDTMMEQIRAEGGVDLLLITSDRNGAIAHNQAWDLWPGPIDEDVFPEIGKGDSVERPFDHNLPRQFYPRHQNVSEANMRWKWGVSLTLADTIEILSLEGELAFVATEDEGGNLVDDHIVLVKDRPFRLDEAPVRFLWNSQVVSRVKLYMDQKAQSPWLSAPEEARFLYDMRQMHILTSHIIPSVIRQNKNDKVINIVIGGATFEELVSNMAAVINAFAMDPSASLNDPERWKIRMRIDQVKSVGEQLQREWDDEKKLGFPVLKSLLPSEVMPSVPDALIDPEAVTIDAGKDFNQDDFSDSHIIIANNLSYLDLNRVLLAANQQNAWLLLKSISIDAQELAEFKDRIGWLQTWSDNIGSFVLEPTIEQGGSHVSSGKESSYFDQGIVKTVILSKLERVFPGQSVTKWDEKGKWQRVVEEQVREYILSGIEFGVRSLENGSWTFRTKVRNSRPIRNPNSLATRLLNRQVISPVIQMPIGAMVDNASRSLLHKAEQAKLNGNAAVIILIDVTGWEIQFLKFYDQLYPKLEEAGVEKNLIFQPIRGRVHKIGEYTPTVQQALTKAKRQLEDDQEASEVLVIGDRSLIVVDEATDNNIYSKIRNYLSNKADVIAAALDYQVFPQSSDGTPSVAGLTAIVHAGIAAFGNVGVIEYDSGIPGIGKIYVQGRRLYVTFETEELAEKLTLLDQYERDMLDVAA